MLTTLLVPSKTVRNTSDLYIIQNENNKKIKRMYQPLVVISMPYPNDEDVILKNKIQKATRGMVKVKLGNDILLIPKITVLQHKGLLKLDVEKKRR